MTTKPVHSIDDMQGLILCVANTASHVSAFEMMGVSLCHGFE